MLIYLVGWWVKRRNAGGKWMDGWVKVEGVVSGVKVYILLQVIISPKTCHLFEGCWSVIDI
jgi:hypothetical protein